jgi:hypothetical protein
MKPWSPTSQARSQCTDVAILTPRPCPAHVWCLGVRKFPHHPILGPCFLKQNPGFPSSSPVYPPLPLSATRLRPYQLGTTF